MPTVTFLDHDGTSRSVEATPGHSLMEVAVNGGVDGIVAECGGACACATCHVYIPAGWQALTGAASEMEAAMLEGVDDLRDDSRLSCQITVTDAFDGLTVHLPQSQL